MFNYHCAPLHYLPWWASTASAAQVPPPRGKAHLEGSMACACGFLPSLWLVHVCAVACLHMPSPGALSRGPPSRYGLKVVDDGEGLHPRTRVFFQARARFFVFLLMISNIQVPTDKKIEKSPCRGRHGVRVSGHLGRREAWGVLGRLSQPIPCV